ncbi:MAG: hypothetical protein NTW87_12385, partial [Planctomycetota bacterium]|nr:hypothetical protein [Planctomycetota bacterium]
PASSSVVRPAAEVTLLRALELAVQRRASAEQLLDLLQRAGWALVPRTAPRDGETWDLVRTVALSAAYRADDVFASTYAAVVEQAENTLRRRLDLVARARALPPSELDVEVPA